MDIKKILGLSASACLVAVWIMLIAPLFRQMTHNKIDFVRHGDLPAIQEVLELYRAEHGDYPTGQNALQQLVDTKPGYLKIVRLDRWGSSFIYRHEPSSQSYVLYSPGINTVDEQANRHDITTWPKRYRCEDYGVNYPPTFIVLVQIIAELTFVIGILTIMFCSLIAVVKK